MVALHQLEDITYLKSLCSTPRPQQLWVYSLTLVMHLEVGLVRWSWNLSIPVVFTKNMFWRGRIRREYRLPRSLKKWWVSVSVGDIDQIQMKFPVYTWVWDSCILGWCSFYFDFQIFLNQCKDEGKSIYFGLVFEKMFTTPLGFDNLFKWHHGLSCHQPQQGKLTWDLFKVFQP